MDFTLTDTQLALRETAQRFLASRAAVSGATGGIAGWDSAWWPALAGLGWLDPDLGTVEQVLLAEQAGEALLAGPWLTTAALAAPALRAAGRPPHRPATLAWSEPAPGAGSLVAARTAAVSCRAVRRNGVIRLYGAKRFVPQPDADVVVVANEGTGPGLYLVDISRHGDGARALSTLDDTRPLAELELSGAPAEPLVDAERTPSVLRTTRRHALAMLAAEAVGVAQRALDLAVEYAGVRTQFGRPIGSYQAVSHRLADAAVGVQLARSLAYRAAWCVQTASADADDAVLTATVAARNGALGSCESAVQTFGGIGFTWTHPLHRLYRRARWIAAFDGATTAYRAELAALLIDQAPPTTRPAPTAAAAPAPPPPPAPSTLAVGGRPSPT